MAAEVGRGPVEHSALFYRSEEEYLAAVPRFILNALSRRDKVLVMIPGPRSGSLRSALGADAQRVSFTDMADIGRNPARILSAMQDFAAANRGSGLSYVGEPAWPGRSESELREVVRHEALCNLAFPGGTSAALCPYAAALPASVLSAAGQTHPLGSWPPGRGPDPSFLGPGGLPRLCRGPLPDPPPGAAELCYRTDLQAVRELVRHRAREAGLPGPQTSNLVLAASELAANTLRHTVGTGTVRVWRTAREVLCEVRDQGWIRDPLAGRQRPQAGQQGGQGLRVVNQVCDLAEVRTGPAGTTIRLHMRLSGS